MNKVEPVEDFLENLCADYEILLKHDFLAIKQGEYLKFRKDNLVDGEFVVCLDFAENYTCHVQDAIQSHHWSARQATVHPYVIYYKENDKIKHLNYVMISEKVLHDASAINLFNTKMIAHLKSHFGEENVKKIYYFSDGPASQYKN